MTEPDQTVARRIIRTRHLPGSRALVGALLVTVAAVGIFAAYAGADGRPQGRYVVARAAVAPGTALTREHVTVETGDVPAALAGRLYSSLEEVEGAVTLAPLVPGDVVQPSALLPVTVDGDGNGAGATPAREFSFAVERERAVNGDLRAGERVDVLATYGTGEGATTVVVTRDALVAEVDEGTTSIGSTGTIVMTIAVDRPDDVLALAHAVDTAAVTVVRATRVVGDTDGSQQYTPSLSPIASALPR
jgi:hypothetical protein